MENTIQNKMIELYAGAQVKKGVFLNRLRKDEEGSEIVQTVIVLGFAVGLGAALLLMQGNIQDAIEKAGKGVTDMFTKITSGQA